MWLPESATFSRVFGVLPYKEKADGLEKITLQLE
jgi:hypothetical protein